MKRVALFLLLVWSAFGCATPRQTIFRPEKLAAMDVAINEAIASNKCPGGVLWLERNGTAYHKAFGSRALVPAREAMTEDTIFDAASLTKVVATTPAVMLLIERGQIKLDARVTNYLPEFTGDGKELVTVRELLTHTSGLPPDIETKTDWHGQAEAIKKACAIKLQSKPGTAFKYSDINFFLLGEIVQRVSRTPLEIFVRREIYAPLKMTDTGFLPPKEKLPRIAPTEVVSERRTSVRLETNSALQQADLKIGVPYRGVVHDPTARHMGGVAGHAGLFTKACDLSRYARMLLNLGELDGVRIFKPETVKLMTSVQTPPEISVKRGLGWDIDSSFSGPRGEIFPVGSYGHTGWTGGSLWIDPFSKTFVIFLSNRNHPTESGSVIALRHKLGTLAGEAVENFDFTQAPGSPKR
jgi:CubicO group peptidase (beta-lactamase class C family)